VVGLVPYTYKRGQCLALSLEISSLGIVELDTHAKCGITLAFSSLRNCRNS
jgi:hypothetical protein